VLNLQGLIYLQVGAYPNVDNTFVSDLIREYDIVDRFGGA